MARYPRYDLWQTLLYGGAESGQPVTQNDVHAARSTSLAEIQSLRLDPRPGLDYLDDHKERNCSTYDRRAGCRVPCFHAVIGYKITCKSGPFQRPTLVEEYISDDPMSESIGELERRRDGIIHIDSPAATKKIHRINMTILELRRYRLTQALADRNGLVNLHTPDIDIALAVARERMAAYRAIDDQFRRVPIAIETP